MLHKLYIFKEVYEQNSFSAAASKLYITQPTVSKIIKSIETELSCSLFERNGSNGIVATKQADLLYKKASKLVNDWKDTVNLIKDTDFNNNECNIGFSQTVGETYFSIISAKFISLFPNVNFRFIITNSDEILTMVMNNEIDFGYLEKPVDSKDLIKEEVFIDQMVLVENKQSNVWLNREHESGVRFYNDLYLFNNPNKYQQIYINSSLLIKETIKNKVGNTIMSLKSVDSTMNYSTLDDTFNRKIFVIHNNQLHHKQQEILSKLNQMLKEIT
ncbi:DNA-binding transcriptional LysR family regulator [Bacilli bacterium PM5-3]|nr:DNA-binding transcriptional LysR family regulator [Bacilli bacterium PM5-3]MDH6603838.1 DNA-binding transcriptional LysR family regulator [Bacilli bacterium PM5-9]